MPEEFRIWQIGDDEAAHLLTRTPRMDTEKNLEDILAKNPELLGDGVALVGRQIGTGSGPLDLLGVTADGTLVVYELKRGGTPRDAITQALDYASALDGKSETELAQHIAEHSGHDGIPLIEDFANWYADHSSNSDLSRRGRTAICCVGVGVDEATTRMARWLREAGIDISIIEFAAYRENDKQLLARYVEVENAGQSAARAGSDAAFDPRDRADERNARPQFDRAVEIVRDGLSAVEHHEYPHKNLLRFWVPRAADDGSGRRQVNITGVCVRTDQGAMGQIYIVVYVGVAQSMAKEYDEMREGFERVGVTTRSTPHDKNWKSFHISSFGQVTAIEPALRKFLNDAAHRFGGAAL